MRAYESCVQLWMENCLLPITNRLGNGIILVTLVINGFCRHNRNDKKLKMDPIGFFFKLVNLWFLHGILILKFLLSFQTFLLILNSLLFAKWRATIQ